MGGEVVSSLSSMQDKSSFVTFVFDLLHRNMPTCPSFYSGEPELNVYPFNSDRITERVTVSPSLCPVLLSDLEDWRAGPSR